MSASWGMWLLFAGVGALWVEPMGAQDADAACPHAALRPLLATEGEWQVTWRDRLAPDRYVTSRARSVITPVVRGCGLLERFEGTREGRAFTALALVAPAGDDSLDRVWQDSEHGQVLLFRASAGGLPLRFEWSRDLGDRVLRLRLTYLALGPDRFTTETELSPDGGRSWALVGRMEYRRTDPPATGTGRKRQQEPTVDRYPSSSVDFCTIRPTSPYRNADSASSQKLRWVSSSMRSSGWPVALEKIRFSRSRIRRISRASMSMSLAVPPAPPAG